MLILDIDTPVVGGASQREVTLVDFSSWREVHILTDLAASMSQSFPIVNTSPGTGDAFLIYGLGGGQHRDVAVRRSDNGDVLCALPYPITPVGQTYAEVMGTQVWIHYTVSGGTGLLSQTLKCTI